jgi:hypothetical protein
MERRPAIYSFLPFLCSISRLLSQMARAC